MGSVVAASSNISRSSRIPCSRPCRFAHADICSFEYLDSPCGRISVEPWPVSRPSQQSRHWPLGSVAAFPHAHFAEPCAGVVVSIIAFWSPVAHARRYPRLVEAFSSAASQLSPAGAALPDPRPAPDPGTDFSNSASLASSDLIVLRC